MSDAVSRRGGSGLALLVAVLVVTAGLPAPVVGASATTVELSPTSQSIDAGNTTTYDVVVTNASGGVGAWDFTVSVPNASVATITNVSLNGDPGETDVAITDNGSTAEVKAALADTADSGAVSVATITVTGATPGTTDLLLDVAAVGDEAGTNYEVTGTTDASMTVAADDDDSGDDDSGSTDPPAINAELTAAETTVAPLDTVVLNGSRSSGDNLTYHWAFGDGTTANDTASVIEHSYDETGTYTVTLTVEDETGQTTTATLEITVTEEIEDETPGFGVLATLLALLVVTGAVRRGS